jgi:hypothetical protein
MLILLLCLAAAVRVFVFAAAFPFFANVDESLHFDVITQYAHGQLPRGFHQLSEETLNWIVPYASPEFLFAPEQFPNGKYPAPLWKQTGPEVDREIAATKAAWSSEINFESSQPPLYYTVAGAWWWIGKQIGLSRIPLYWIRFLNVPLVALIVLLGYVTARTVFRECVELRLGVPLLLAFIPQRVFYTMNNDVLSPLCFGMLFLFVLQWLRAESGFIWLGALIGLTIAATYLTKLSNLPLVAVALVLTIARLLLIIRRTPRVGLTALAALAVCAAVPIGSWMVWTTFQFGDLTGSREKIALLGWTRKPFHEWRGHPVFTPHGLWVFWSSLIASFWRGELTWQGRLLNWGRADVFFVKSSLIVLGSAVAGLARRAGLSTFQRQAIGIAILIWVAGIVFLGLLSIQFDFGDSTGPSRAHPYFTAGRLLSGALIPFALVYVYGVASVCRLATAILPRARSVDTILPLVVLGAIVVFTGVSEIAVNRPVFASEHNWFHR